jgi:hypothetical protein
MDEQAHAGGESVWRKSLASGTGDCVEVAFFPGRVLVRDSKAPELARLEFTASEWKAFLLGVHRGEFELRPDA